MEFKVTSTDLVQDRTRRSPYFAGNYKNMIKLVKESALMKSNRELEKKRGATNAGGMRCRGVRIILGVGESSWGRG